MGSMRRENNSPGNGAATREWTEFRAGIDHNRKELDRLLRREMVHDARADMVATSISVADLADEAICRTLDDWKSKPASTSAGLWLRKRALQLLDETLDREALAEESREEQDSVERRLVAQDVLDDDEERSRWLDVAELANPSRTRDLDSTEVQAFDGLSSDPTLSSPERRLADRERLVELERAMMQLSEARRKAVAHRYLDGLTPQEIAYLMDRSVQEVEREIQSGLRELQLQMSR